MVEVGEAHEGSSWDVDVVILTWNDGPLLEVAVRSALASEGVKPHVVVVDNGSEPPATVADATVRLVRNEENVGVSGGRNQGAGYGSAPILCFLDSDAELARHSLWHLAQVLDDPTVAVAVPVFANQAPEASAGAAPTLLVKLARGLGWRNNYQPVAHPVDATEWDVEFGIGACQVIRRAAFAEVGGLDDSIFYGPEDVDFCLRVREVGHRVVQAAGADVRHPPRRSFRRPLTRAGMRHTRSIVRHLWRHRSGRGRRQTSGGA